MHKKRIIYSLVILVLFIGLIIFSQRQKPIASIYWPKSSLIVENGAENYQITLNEKFITSQGKWPKNTEFLIEENQIKQISSSSDITFFGFLLKGGALIEHVTDQDYELYLKSEVNIDGMPLNQECLLIFKNKVLFSARCPGEDEVFFKRFIKPEMLNFEVDGSIEVVE